MKRFQFAQSEPLFLLTTLFVSQTTAFASDWTLSTRKWATACAKKSPRFLWKYGTDFNWLADLAYGVDGTIFLNLRNMKKVFSFNSEIFLKIVP